MNPYPSFATSLSCSNCGTLYPLETMANFATCCIAPLLVDYTIQPFVRESLAHRNNTLWRYAEMLPVLDATNIVSLGEGGTPLLTLQKTATLYDFDKLYLKDETYNPTGSFKARGISVAVSKAKELGIQKCIIPTAGNAGGALAAYCAKAGIACTVVMPVHTPNLFKQECRLYGATLVEVEGLINDCGKEALQQLAQDPHLFDMSTLKEPYRLEGKKTMGYEIAEQLGWQLPDVIVYPTGGGTGLIGIWKAFGEMIALGWVEGPLPKMIAVQAENCAPVLAAYNDPLDWKQGFGAKPSIANGLAVPTPFGMKMMQEIIQQSRGTVIAISEAEILEGVREVAFSEGVFLSPEGSAVIKALPKLKASGYIKAEDTIVALNTGSGYKYMENLLL
jgi:threonine synthase